jgi:hypothetical protein
VIAPGEQPNSGVDAHEVPANRDPDPSRRLRVRPDREGPPPEPGGVQQPAAGERHGGGERDHVWDLRGLPEAEPVAQERRHGADVYAPARPSR